MILQLQEGGEIKMSMAYCETHKEWYSIPSWKVSTEPLFDCPECKTQLRKEAWEGFIDHQWKYIRKLVPDTDENKEVMRFLLDSLLYGDDYTKEFYDAKKYKPILKKWTKLPEYEKIFTHLDSACFRFQYGILDE